MADDPGIALVLGSGAARGWAHVGVIHALQEADVPIRYIAGTSMGALIGGAHAANSLDDIEDIALSMDWKDFLYYFSDLSFSGSGLIDGRKIADFLRKHFKWPLIEKLPIPFAAVATDVMTGEEIVFREGDVIDAIRASISIPGIFTPVHLERPDDVRTLVDGGLVNPIPVSVARSMGDAPIVAVDINHDMVRQRNEERGRIRAAEKKRKGERASALLGQMNALLRGADLKSVAGGVFWRTRKSQPGVVDVLGNTVRIMEQRIGRGTLEADPPDLLVRPKVGAIDYMEFHRVEEAIEAGYRATHDAIPEIEALLKR